MTTIRESAGATTTSNFFPKMEVTLTPPLSASTSQTAPMADPYNPGPGRAAQRAHRQKIEERETSVITWSATLS